MSYPEASDPAKVGEYPALTHAGGGLVWDEVLEYRVWCHPERGAADLAEGDDCFFAYATYEEAERASTELAGAEEPLALILQREWIDEPEGGVYLHVKHERLTEWPVEFLSRPRRNDRTIPGFLAPDAPPNRLAILRGEVPRP